jgi:DNA-binding response OmpR family regulator
MSRILVVEDEPVIAAGLVDELKAEGYEVGLAEDGDAGYAMAREGTWDLILLDVMLPGRDGWAVCRELRRERVMTPVLLLTALSREQDKIRGLDLGADDYLTKPFSPGELLARVRALLRRTGRRAQHAFGNCVLDVDRCALTKAGRAVDLTAVEFKLLRTFVENAGKVMSIDELLRRAWGADVFLTDRVIYTHVNNLRGKVEDDPGKPRHLVSVRGLGYRFDP